MVYGDRYGVSMIEFPLSSSYYLDALQLESERFANAARHVGFDREIVTCPGWNVAAVVLHVGVLHRWAAAMVAGGHAEPLDRAAFEFAPDGAERITWFESGSSALIEVFSEVGPDREVWTRLGMGRSKFWFRRVLQETMVHRFDIELAAGSLGAVDPVVAADGIDEYWTVQLERKLALRPVSTLAGVLELRATDVDVAWTVRLNENTVTAVKSGFPADVTVTGPAYELLSFLWSRDQLGIDCSVEGDRRLVDAWHDLVHL